MAALQEAGLWRYAATLAARALSGDEKAAALERWALHIHQARVLPPRFQAPSCRGGGGGAEALPDVPAGSQDPMQAEMLSSVLHRIQLGAMHACVGS